MRTKIISCLICTLIISTVFVIAEPINSKSNIGTSSIIDYQIGFKCRNGSLTWSAWASDGYIANATFDSFSFLADLLMRIEAPGYHVQYQVGFKNRDENIIWSALASDGGIANATFNFIRLPVTLYMKINSPGYHVKCQIGFKNRNEDINWSLWASDGNIANTTFNYIHLPSAFCMRAIMIVPIPAIIDIDPNTLNLKSKGRWITCYIDLPTGYDVNDINDINISTIMLEDTIPAEWGDIQGDSLMVKFDRSEVEDMLAPGTYNLKVTGELTDGTEFEGYSDEIRVIDPGK